jgi:hypothetical protein
METALTRELTINAEWERLDEGSPEERACFAAVNILIGNISMTEGVDAFVKRVRPAPLLSAYHLAEWIAWNWWRLRWEPRSNSPDWAFAHRLPTIGSGYIWPNITIFSDGQRTALISRPTSERPVTPFRYLSDTAAIVSSSNFEAEIDRFVAQTLGQLNLEKINDTNLHRIWQELSNERRDKATAEYRKFEALLGSDPDKGDMGFIEGLGADAKAFGQSAMNEMAADHAQGGRPLTGDDLATLSTRSGYDGSPNDVVRLSFHSATPYGQVAAWRLGASAARALREQERLGNGILENDRLAGLVAVEKRALAERSVGTNISFALDSDHNTRVVFRSKWPSGRRFELARLLADRIVMPQFGRLFPATRSYTYRQKMQRSFAAELLSPFEAVDEILGGDYSIENQQDVAEYFQVSEITIRTLLVNHSRLEREELELDFDVMAA